MPHHLEPVRAGPADPGEPGDVWSPLVDDGEFESRVRPTWWRWVAIAVIAAMVVAGPFAFALYKLLT